MLLWPVAAIAVVAALLGVGADAAAAQGDVGDASTFSDDDGSVHEPGLDALASRGLLAGMVCGDRLICPEEPLKRWEMAVWLVRVLDGADPDPIEESRFVDVDAGLWWAPFVDRLFELEVTAGCRTEPARFCPDRNATRAQAATFLTRAFALDRAPPAGFTDVSADGTHSVNIASLAGAGLTVGCRRDPLEYCPAHSVTRGQMATLLARALDRPDPAACRVHGTPDYAAAGHPRPWSVAPTTGTVRVAVLFMDFPDTAADYPTRIETGAGLVFAEDYLEGASYGALDIDFVTLHRWLRSEHESTHYLVGPTLQELDSEAARLADPYLDFSDIDILMTVLPSPYFSGGAALGLASTDEGLVRATVRINAHWPPVSSAGGSVPGWGWVAAHELLHTLGLADLYSAGRTREVIDVPPGKLLFDAEIGIMGLSAYFLLDELDPRARTYSSVPDGEMLAWSRWQLGWLDRDQVDCVTGDGATVALRPVALDPGTGTAMAAVPLTADEAIVLESRRLIGRDTQHFLEEGVLVYTVNAAVGTGNLPIKVVGKPDGGFPVLRAGESVTVRGYTITVVADDGDTHTVVITRDGEG